ncbi:MAG: dockerin type I domain-containing protein [Porcipelethomonas sp.]
MKLKSVKSAALSLTLSAGLLASGLPVSAQLSDSEITEAIRQYDKSFDTELESSGIENVYKSYALDGFYNKDYYDAESFESLISGEIRTYVEVGGQLVTLLERDGKLKAVGETLQIGKSVVELELESQKIKNDIDGEISDMKFCNFSMLGLALIYYKTADGNEFVVPYIEDVFGEYTDIIQSGELYSASEFIEQMRLIFDISNYDPDAEIGIPDTYIVGDANSDYNVDVRDCTYIAKMISSNRKDMLGDVCDYNKDGVINVRDAASIAISLANR